MKNLTGAATAFIFWFIMLSPGKFMSTAADNGKNTVENPLGKPSAKDMVREAYSLLTRSSLDSWDKVKSLINQVQIKFSPPNLDFRSVDDATNSNGGHNSAGEKVKEAAEKSLGTSKLVVEESANLAAKAVGEIVHKTKEKMSGSESAGEGSGAEL